MDKYSETKIKVSAIIPVWNSAAFIGRCIDSLRNQTLRDIEMIFIDDRGSDDSMEIVKKAQAEDPRIHIITNQVNSGAGVSRNKGIEAAKGEYLSFIDSDDYIAPDFMELLYNTACKEGLDIVKGSRVNLMADGNTIPPKKDLNPYIMRGLSNKAPLYSLFRYEHQSALYRRQMIIDNNVRYGTTRRAQDTTFLLYVCPHCNKFDIVNEAKYYYCENQQSVVHSLDPSMLRQLIDAYKEKVDYVVNNLYEPPHSDTYISLMTSIMIMNLYRFGGKEGIDEIRSYIESLPCSESLQKRFFPARALVLYHEVLPHTPLLLPWKKENSEEWTKLISHWVDFTKKNPDSEDQYEERLFVVFENAYKASKNENWPKEAIRSLSKSKRRLSLHLRKYLLLRPISHQIKKIKKTVKKILFSLFLFQMKMN